MPFRRRFAVYAASLLCATFWMRGQQAEPQTELTSEQLTKAAKIYFRDTAELPLEQKTTILVADASGRVRQNKTQATQYVFQGYRRSQKTLNLREHGKVSFWEAMRGYKILRMSLGSALWTLIPGDILYADPGETTLAMNPAGLPARSNDELLTVQITPVKSCPAFAFLGPKIPYFPSYPCGVSEFQLHHDLSFQRFSFDQSGLPATADISPFGECTLQRYHVEIEFQKVMLPGDKEPFLVPRQSLARLETNKGSVVITGLFEPKK